jgi:hypothetical protein
MPLMNKNSILTGKQFEYHVISKMLAEGMELYVPVADVNGIDLLIRKPNGKLAEIQIKGRTEDVKNPARFVITHEERPNYWFLFLVPIWETQNMYILSSKEFIKECPQDKKGQRTINLGRKKQGKWIPDNRFNKYIAKDFSHIIR